MKAKLEQELTNLKQGDHICSIYENMDEQLAVVIPFIIEGLAEESAVSISPMTVLLKKSFGRLRRRVWMSRTSASGVLCGCRPTRKHTCGT